MKKQATMVFLEKNDELLFLVRRKENDTTHRQGMYLPIGGKVEPGESVIDCARREVREESSIDVGSLELRGVLHFTNWGPDGHDWVDFLFVSSEFSGEPKGGNEGHFEWVKKKKIETLNLYAGDKIFLPEIIQNNFIVAEFQYAGFELKSHQFLTKVKLR